MTARDTLAKVAAATVVTTLGLIVVGGIVRVTGSGMACPDWPKCHGQWIPPLELGIWLEYIHRVIAAIVSPLVLATAVLAVRVRGGVPGVAAPAVAGVALLITQIALGAWTVFTGNRGDTVIAHLLMALLLVGAITVVAVRSAHAAGPASAVDLGADRSLRRRALWLVALTLALALVGSAVQVTNGGFSCPDFPLCGGQLWPSGYGLPAELHMIHRALALVVGVVLVVVALRARRSGDVVLRRWSEVAGALFALQAVVGIAQVAMVMPMVLRGAHLALAALMWTAVVALYAHVAAQPVAARVGAGHEPRSVVSGAGAGAGA